MDTFAAGTGRSTVEFEPREVCPSCDEGAVTYLDQEKRFSYGGEHTKTPEVRFRVMVPVGRCDKCNFMFTDRRAEEIIDKVVRDYQEKNPQQKPGLFIQFGTQYHGKTLWEG